MNRITTFLRLSRRLGEPKCLVLTLLLLALPTTAPAQFNYTTNGNAIIITGYTGPGLNVAIPSAINGLPVIGIGTLAFDASSVTNLTIPESIGWIGDLAFYRCDQLLSVSLPSSLTSIGSQAFWACSSLPAITIPSSVTNLGHSPFEWCFSMTAISVEDLNPVYSSQGGILFDKHQKVLLQCPRGKTGSVVIPPSVTHLETYAFASCKGLTNIAIPSSLTSLSDYAFIDCSSLTSVTIPSSIRSIGAWTFGSCAGLTMVAVPSGVTNIGERAFDYCVGVTSGLTNISIPETVTGIGASAFGHCYFLTAIMVHPLNPAYSSVDGVLFNRNHTSLIQCPGGRIGSYAIPEGVVSIGPGAFSECSGVASITIPASVSTISDFAFASCSLTNLTIPSGVSVIGSAAFLGCGQLRSVFFEGNSPVTYSESFTSTPATIYYLPGTSGWNATYGGRPTARWMQPSPRILTLPPFFGVQSNQFRFRVSWATNLPVVVEACANWGTSQWIPLATNSPAPAGGFSFKDPQWTNYPSRIYRVRSQ